MQNARTMSTNTSDTVSKAVDGHLSSIISNLPIKQQQQRKQQQRKPQQPRKQQQPCVQQRKQQLSHISAHGVNNAPQNDGCRPCTAKQLAALAGGRAILAAKRRAIY